MLWTYLYCSCRRDDWLWCVNFVFQGEEGSIFACLPALSLAEFFIYRSDRDRNREGCARYKDSLFHFSPVNDVCMPQLSPWRVKVDKFKVLGSIPHCTILVIGLDLSTFKELPRRNWHILVILLPQFSSSYILWQERLILQLFRKPFKKQNNWWIENESLQLRHSSSAHTSPRNSISHPPQIKFSPCDGFFYSVSSSTTAPCNFFLISVAQPGNWRKPIQQSKTISSIRTIYAWSPRLIQNLKGKR